VRCKFDKEKSEQLRKNPERKIGFEEAQEIWNYPYYEDQLVDNPEQYRAVGWVKGRLCSVIFEIREDEEGKYYHFVTLWKSTSQEEKLYEEKI